MFVNWCGAARLVVKFALGPVVHVIAVHHGQCGGRLQLHGTEMFIMGPVRVFCFIMGIVRSDLKPVPNQATYIYLTDSSCCVVPSLL